MISVGHSLGFHEKENDLMGFVFDPYDTIKSGYYNHIKELSYLKSHQWVDSHGNIVNMTKIDIHYLVNIYTWMDRAADNGWEYDATRQYKFLKRRIANEANKVRLAQRILGKHMGWEKL